MKRTELIEMRKSKKIVLALVAILCVVSILSCTATAAYTLSWNNQTKTTRFSVALSSTSFLKKTATIKITNSAKSDDTIIVTCLSKASCISGVSASGSTLIIAPGKSRSYSVSVKALNSGSAKFQVACRSGGARYSYTVSVSGGAFNSMAKCA